MKSIRREIIQYKMLCGEHVFSCPQRLASPNSMLRDWRISQAYANSFSHFLLRFTCSYPSIPHIPPACSPWLWWAIWLGRVRPLLQLHPPPCNESQRHSAYSQSHRGGMYTQDNDARPRLTCGFVYVCLHLSCHYPCCLKESPWVWPVYCKPFWISWPDHARIWFFSLLFHCVPNKKHPHRCRVFWKCNIVDVVVM